MQCAVQTASADTLWIADRSVTSASRSGADAGSMSTRNSRQSARNGGRRDSGLGPLPRLTSILRRAGAGASEICLIGLTARDAKLYALKRIAIYLRPAQLAISYGLADRPGAEIAAIDAVVTQSRGLALRSDREADQRDPHATRAARFTVGDPRALEASARQTLVLDIADGELVERR